MNQYKVFVHRKELENPVEKQVQNRWKHK